MKKMSQELRTYDYDELDNFEKSVCSKRKNENEHHQLAFGPKTTYSPESKIKMLVIEQAMADVLFQSTGNIDVYKMNFEELCDNIEIFNLVKKYPSQERKYYSQSIGKYIAIAATKRINTASIEKLAKEYQNEVKEWLHEEAQSNEKLKLIDLLYILNPDENMPEKDDAVSDRIKSYKMNLE